MNELDYAQICPVKEKKLSKAFELPNVYHLTKVYRQKGDNPLLDILYELRSEARYEFNSIVSETGSLIKYYNWKEFLNNNMHQFDEMIDNKDPNYVKLIAYSNKRVASFNHEIRKILFHNENEYNVHDMLFGYNNCEYKINKYTGHEIKNSNDYYVEKVEPISKHIGFTTYRGYNLTLYSFEDQHSFTVFMLSRNNTSQSFATLATLIESTRMNAIEAPNLFKQKKLWVEYFNLIGSFLSPYDLSYDGRIVYKKSLDYGYCITSHKS